MTPFQHRVCYSWEFGVVDDYNTDNAQALNDIISKATAGDEIVLPPGFVSSTRPLLPIPGGARLRGAGGKSSLVRRYSGDVPLVTYGEQYSSVEDLIIFTDDGCSGGFAVGHIAPDPDHGSYHTVLRNITISNFATGRWFGGVRIDGSMGAQHFGTRAHILDGLLISRCNDYGLLLSGANGVNVSNLTVVEGTWGIWITGSADNPSNNVYMSGVGECNVLFDVAHNCKIDAAPVGFVVATDQAASCRVDCTSVSTTPSLSGVNNHVFISPDLHWDSP